jgi:hypothetical protein
LRIQNEHDAHSEPAFGETQEASKENFWAIYSTMSASSTRAAREAVHANRRRPKSGLGRAAMRKRSEMVERSLAHTLDCGGMRRCDFGEAKTSPSTI